MKFSTFIRIMRDSYANSGLRQQYWDMNALIGEIMRLPKRQNRVFMRHVLKDQWRYITCAIQPETGKTLFHASKAVEWLLYAQQVTEDDGVSIGYFPCRREGVAWLPSYPETSGYIATTLLTYARCFDDSAAKDAALKMLQWEIAIQMPTGAVQGGPVCLPDKQTAAAFNTGMVLDGWCSAFSATSDERFLEAGRRAADFLVADIDPNGYFHTNGSYVSADEIKTYTCLCAWAMYRFGTLAGERHYQEAAIRTVEAALRQQQANGWFAHNCLTRSTAPLTHTIGYTLQGILEVGVAAERLDIVTATRLSVDALITRINQQGLLAGRFYADWEPAAFSSCLTGNAQIAIVCYRLFELTGEIKYKQAANRLVDALKVLQVVDSTNLALNGAIAGSFPIFGGYMRAGYPNWATKYFVDALLLQHQINNGSV
ncbi:hypothetical protein [Nitrosomonas cryotolerans]|nr:hypothetical protein [Nitrosomonas cryotolerans]